jgi:hypothetical protein
MNHSHDAGGEHDNRTAGLIRIEGGAYSNTWKFLDQELAPGEDGVFLLRPQLTYRPDFVMLFGAIDVDAAREKPRIVRAIFNGEALELGPSEEGVIDDGPPGMICSATLRGRADRALPAASFFEVVIRNGGQKAKLTPVVVGMQGEHDGMGKPPIGRLVPSGMSLVQKRDGKQAFELAPSSNGVFDLAAIKTRFMFPTRIRRLEITTDARPGEIEVLDLKVGTHSQLTSEEHLPAELFSRKGGGAFETDRCELGVVTELVVWNKSPKRRLFSFAFYVDPKEPGRG